MHICEVKLNHQFVFHNLPKLHKFSSKKKPSVLLCFAGGRKWGPSHIKFPFSSSFQNPILRTDKFVVRVSSASSSAPLSGSGAEYTDQLLGGTPKQKTQRVAGVDKEEIEDPTLIADSDSCFCEFNGVQLHHKIYDAEVSNSDTFEGSSSQSLDQSKRLNFPMILLHGFGASVFSWDRVMKPLARVIGSKVLAFDRPAFGLTSRANAINHSSPDNKDTRPLNPYSMAFSVLATLYFIDFLAAQKAILVGHSAGALVALDAYFEAPERVAALILVAPAILAPFTVQNAREKSQGGRDSELEGKNSDSNKGRNPFLKFYSILSKFTTYIAEAIAYIVKGMGDMINSLYKKALSAILRSTLGVMLIRMIIDKFGIAAIRRAWYDSNQVSDNVLQGYTKPLKVKGWDKALVEYTVAMLTDTASKLKPPMAKRLAEISCPVLIITGDTDRLVPSWNSEKLSRAIPGSHLEIIKNCGHLPQEEKAEEFVSIVDKFLQRVFGTTEEPLLEAVT
ncbi:hypothetical protein ACJIZ3_009458 [Penstemon smallii]|uniref:AB hydrolase-1 domain-containing protein n=1 Tax=Penstemon smallii TaxID=265156 RepID=A0ABD3TCK3_9LAMI